MANFPDIFHDRGGVPSGTSHISILLDGQLVALAECWILREGQLVKYWPPDSEPEEPTVAEWFLTAGAEGIRSPEGMDWGGTLDADLAGTFICSADGVLMRSSGVSFDGGASFNTPTYPGAETQRAGLIIDGVYLVFSTNTTVYFRSTDGETFAGVAVPSNLSAGRCVSATPSLILVGDNAGIGGELTRSADLGATWGGPELSFGGSGSSIVQGIANNGTTFVLVGENNTGTRARMASTTDGVTMTPITVPFSDTSKPVFFCAYDEVHENFIAINEAGEVAYGGPVSWALSADNLGTLLQAGGIDSYLGRTILVNQSEKLYVSNDGGATWELRPTTFAGTNLRGICALRPAA